MDLVLRYTSAVNLAYTLYTIAGRALWSHSCIQRLSHKGVIFGGVEVWLANRDRCIVGLLLLSPSNTTS